MKILVTGAHGFVGKNLVEALKCLRDGKDKTRPELIIEEIFEYDIDSTHEELDAACREADFVFNLAGVNRPMDTKEFMRHCVRKAQKKAWIKLLYRFYLKIQI